MQVKCTNMFSYDRCSEHVSYYTSIHIINLVIDWQHAYKGRLIFARHIHQATHAVMVRLEMIWEIWLA